MKTNNIKVSEKYGVITVNGAPVRDVTNPIQAQDLHTPRVVPISPRRWLVVGYKSEQVAELVALGGKYTPAYRGGLGVVFAASEDNRHRLHVWQNEKAKEERAAILGEGWQYCGNLGETARAKVGDEVCTIDGTTGTVTKTAPESCVIEFKDDKTGRALSVAGFFFRTPFNWEAYHEEQRRRAELAAIIETAKQQESRTISGYNYGPIKYLRDRVLYADNGKTTAENMKEYEKNLQAVTDPETYAVYLLSSYDVFVDETQVFCDLRRAFPSLSFAELCQLIRDHMGENQQGDGIAAALVPDCVILSSADEYTRRTFAERHKKYNRRTADGCTADELRRHYDRESLTLHAILSAELFYLWEDDRAARCLESVREIYPDTTAQELREIYERYREPISDIYD